MVKLALRPSQASFLLLLSVIATGCQPQYTFQKLADTNTTMPGGSQKFTKLEYHPAYDGTNVVFMGGGDSNHGVYRFNAGGLSRVLDQTVTIANSAGSPTTVGFLDGNHGPVADSGRLVFAAIVDSYAVCSDVSGSLKVELDNSQRFAAPYAQGVFTSVLAPSLSSGHIVFTGTAAADEDNDGLGDTFYAGIYRAPHQLIVDHETVIPQSGGKTFAYDAFSFEDSIPVVEGSQVVFWGTDNRGEPTFQGIYLADLNTPNSLVRVVDTNTAIPGGHGLFASFSKFPDVDGNRVLFRGYGSNGYGGLFLATGGTITKIADTNTTIPGRTEHFQFSSNIDQSFALSNGWAVFADGNPNGRGLYTNYGGSLKTILETGDPLNGGSVNPDTPPQVGRYGFRGNNLVFYANTVNAAGARMDGVYFVDLSDDRGTLSGPAWIPSFAHLVPTSVRHVLACAIQLCKAWTSASPDDSP